MSKQPEPHPVGTRRKIRPDGADRKESGNGQR